MSPQSPALLSTSPSTLPRSISLPVRTSGSRSKAATAPSQLATTFESKGAKFFEELHKRSAPASSRPGSSALPVTGRSHPSHQFVPQSVTVGFKPFQPTSVNVPSTASPRPTLKPGLLSQAFTSGSSRPVSNVFSATDLFSGLRDTTVPKDSNIHSRSLTPLQELQDKHEVFKTDLVRLAFLVAERAHKGQLLEHGEPAIQHCLKTAAVLADLGLDLHIVVAGLLHDVLHGTSISKYELQEYMPSQVVELVEAITRFSKLGQTYRDMGQDACAEQLVTAVISLGTEAVLVKLADRLHSMRTISCLPSNEQRSIAQETLDVYAVLANRLGLWSLKAELEDLSFQVLRPDEYAALSQQVFERQNQDFLQASVNQLKQHLDQVGIEVQDISGRPKNLYGIHTKMKKDGLALEQVYDVYAIRVVVNQKDECYMVRDQVCSLWQHMHGRSKDYIRNKKPNGYQSLHETVIGHDGLPFEVQIRTSKMHYIAEYGSSAHWQYKEGNRSSADTADLVKWMRWQAQCQHGVADKKIRPVGSPPKDMSLASLGWEFVGSPHNEKVDPLLLHQRVGLKKFDEKQVNMPVSVSVRNLHDDSARLHELPSGSTLSDLLTKCNMSGFKLEGYKLSVNGQDAFRLDHVLCTGDDVCIQPAQLAPQPMVLSTSNIAVYRLGMPWRAPATSQSQLLMASAATS